jgi:hypothetical protein
MPKHVAEVSYIYELLSFFFIFLIIKPTRCTNFSKIYFGNETLHVLDSSSFHHQELFTVHTAVVYVKRVCRQLSRRILFLLESCLHFQNKFEKLVNLFRFILRKFVTMHGHMSRCTVTCHDARSHVTTHGTCHDARSHVTMHGHMNVKYFLCIFV